MDWKAVNLRASEKNIPEEGKPIVFRKKISTGVLFSTGKVFYNGAKQRYEVENLSGFGDYCAVKTGMIWCYAEDMEADALNKQKG